MPARKTCAAVRKASRLRVRSLWIEMLEARRVLTGPINTQDRVEVVNAYLNRLVPALSVPVGWTGSVNGCVAGTMSNAAQNAFLESVNYFRNMSGLNDVSFDGTFNQKAQQAALMMEANNTLSHTPPSNWTCYTADGATAAGSSNLALGYAGANAIKGYMEDSGSNNTAVGHRRWIQYPFVDKMGVGATTRANALWVFGPRVDAPSPTWLAWPTPGYVTKDLVFNRWSISRAGADFSNASVTVRANNVNYSVRREPVANGYGLNTLVWEVNNMTIPNNTDDFRITVTVGNVIVNGSAQSFQYDVIAISPEMPSLSISVASPSIAENAGSVSNYLTVTRNFADTGSALQVTLSSSDTSEVTVPATVTIPAGARTVTVPVQAVDDSEFDGDQSVNLNASATGFAAATQRITVTDNERVALTLVLNPTSISENGGTSTATISRNGPTTTSLTVNLASNDTSEATVPATVTIPAGLAAATFTVSAVDDTLFDGSQSVTITASATGAVEASQTLTVTDDEVARLTLAFSPNSIRESRVDSTGTITRTGPNASALVVSLSSNDTSELLVPVTVTIPAGSSSATFTAQSVDDAVIDGDQTVVVTASAAGFSPVTATIIVTDDDSVALALSLAATSISENGGSTTGTVSRTGPTTSSLTVTLSSNDQSEATVPATLVIPAGSASATFTVSAVDDTVLDGTQTVEIAAAASGLTTVRATLQVTDDELPALGLTLSAGSINENGGASTATVTRSGSTASSLTITLSSSDVTEATVPATVVIAAGATSATFTVTAVDDALVDGDQNVQIRASAAGWQTATAALVVTDDERLRLTLAFSPSTINENGGTSQGTISRNGPTTSSLVVALASSDATEATVPATVTIPAGASSVTFALTAQDDAELDGTQTVTISATAATFQDGRATVNVTDDEQPALALNLAPSTISEKNGLSTLTVSRTGPTTSPLVVTLASSDTSEATVPATVTIPAGSSNTTVQVSAVDDTLVDGPQPVTISASANGIQGASATLTVTDDELPTVTISLSPRNFSENRGQSTATLTRNGPVSNPLTVNLSSSDTSEATVPSTATFAAGEASTTFIVSGVDDTLVDGNQEITLTVSGSIAQSVTTTAVVEDDEQRALNFANDSVTFRENVGTVSVVLLRTNSTSALTVNLSSSNNQAASVPATVTFPAGSVSVPVPITIIDNSSVDGNRTVNISATGSGVGTASTVVTITDDDAPALSLTSSPSQMAERGGVVVGTVTRSGSISEPLSVSLSVNDSRQASVPTQVVIPAGQRNATFNITAVDDTLAEGNHSVAITAAAAGFTNATMNVSIIDDDQVVPTLEFSAAAMSERGGSLVATLRVPSAAGTNLVFQLSTPTSGAVTMPASVTINAGQTSTTFTVTAVDDAILNGSRSINIVATAGTLIASRSLTITDYETLSLFVAATSVAENIGTVNASVLRSNDDIQSSLTVTLTSSLPARLQVPASVVIPAGQAFAEFVMTVVNDSVLGGDLLATVTPSHTQYESNHLDLTIVEDDPGSPWTNLRNPMDVNADNAISPMDALLIINQLNVRGPGALPSVTGLPEAFYDVSGDGSLSAIDALYVINHLNTHPAGEGESAPMLDRAEAIDYLMQSAWDWQDGQSTRRLASRRRP